MLLGDHTQASTYTQTYVHIHTNKCKHTHTYTLYVYTHIFTCTFAHTHSFTRTFAHIQTHIHPVYRVFFSGAHQFIGKGSLKSPCLGDKHRAVSMPVAKEMEVPPLRMQP